jgi:hypothetical protein
MSGIDYKSCFSVLFATISQKEKKTTVLKLFMRRPLKKQTNCDASWFCFFLITDVDVSFFKCIFLSCTF